MARLLELKMGAQTMTRICKSHVRLLRRGKETSALIDAIVPKIASLEAANKIYIELQEEAQQLLDLVHFDNTLLNDAVRMLGNDCNSHDLKNTMNPAFPTLFPSGGYSSIFKMNVFQQPGEVKDFVTRLKFLGETHVLDKHATLLEQAIANSGAAIATYLKAAQAVKAQKRIENIQKAALVKAYSDNWHDLSKLYGKTIANRYFPKFKSPKHDDRGNDDRSEDE